MAPLSTTPWTTKNSELISQLKQSGYDVRNENGKSVIYVGKTPYIVDLSKPLWVMYAEIGQIEAQNKKDEISQDIKSRAEKCHENYEKIMEGIKETKEQESIFERALNLAKKSLNSLLAKNNAQNISDLRDDNVKKMATEYSNAITENKYNLIRTGSKIISDSMHAFNEALSEGEWNNLALLAKHQ